MLFGVFNKTQSKSDWDSTPEFSFIKVLYLILVVMFTAKFTKWLMGILFPDAWDKIKHQINLKEGS